MTKVQVNWQYQPFKTVTVKNFGNETRLRKAFRARQLLGRPIYLRYFQFLEHLSLDSFSLVLSFSVLYLAFFSITT